MPKIVSFVQTNFQQGPREMNAYYLPYSAGIILASALANNTNWKLGELVWRRDPIESTAQKLCQSDVVGFSTYVWNHQYNYRLAERIKQLNPTCTIVMGGPEPAITDPKIFEKNPWMDIVIKMEGEQTFAKVLATEPADRLQIPGLLLNINGQVLDTGDSERIENLDDLPSPYLSGLFDQLIADYPDITWNATLETNRGCPYQCTFCDWGSLTYNKVKKFDLERVFAELEWIGQHCGFLTIADANFGMFTDRDNEIITKLIEIQHRWGRVKNFSMTWAKNQKPEVVRMVNRLVKESPSVGQGITVSVQSMDEQVLDIVKRRNLDQHKIREIFALCDQHNIPVHTEIILGLPGETEHSWRENFWQLFRAGNHTGISIQYAQLLENAEMNLQQRQFYRLESVPIYDYMSGSYDNGEIDESIDVVVGTRDIPRDRMLNVMVWNSFIQTFHVNGFSNYIARYMAAQGTDYEIFYDRLWQQVQIDPWWKAQFRENQHWYEEWISKGRVHCKVGGIPVPGWHLHNRLTLVIHAENRVEYLYEFLHDFVCKHFDIDYAEQLVDFQQATVIDYARLKQLPEIRTYDRDFWGILSLGESTNQPATYKFFTREDTDMSQQTFLENFYFGRKRNFGKAHIMRLET